MNKRLLTLATILATGLGSADETQPSYNAPARIEPSNEWGVYVDASFLYWKAMQENMELGIVLTSESGSPDSHLISTTSINPGKVVNMDFDYHPGFQVGLGANFDYDHWDAYAEYTWFHGTSTQSTNITGSPNQAILSFAVHPGFQNLTLGNAFTMMSESWNLKMDFVDATLGRWCQVGNHLSFRPFFGARGAWIRQNALYGYLNPTELFSTPLSGNVVLETSRSWGIGPSIGLNANWELGHGLRFIGNGSADLLYTWYTLHTDEAELGDLTMLSSPSSSLDDFQSLAFRFKLFGFSFANGTVVSQMQLTQKHIAYLRPHANLEFGFGWGSYFSQNSWHLDLSGTYGFQAFWDQNMFRHFDDDGVTSNSTLPNGNLYVHGLTATVRLDF